MFSVSAFRVSLIMALLLAATAARAENQGLDDLDQATEAKLTANSFQDLTEVIRLLDGSLTKGLDEDNRQFAQSLLAATLIQRATLISQAIFSPGRPDRRWPQFRQMALVDLSRAVEVAPDSPQAHLLIGRLQILPGGDRDQAREALDEVITTEGVDPTTLAKALTARGGLQTDDAKRLADYSQAIQLVPGDIEAVRARGLFYLLTDKPELAEADLRRAVELDSDHGPTLEALGTAQMLAGKREEALETFNQAIQHSPKSPAPYIQRARLHAVNTDNEAAINDLNQALQLDPNGIGALLLRARVYYQAEKPAEALHDVNEALRLRPAYVPALRLRAELLAGAGKLGEAIADMKRLTEALPANSELLMQLGLFYSANRQPKRAIEIFTAVLTEDQKHWLALRYRADAHLSISEQAEAVADYEAALKLKPDDSGILNNLAWLLCTSIEDELRDGPRAIELALKACELTDYKQGHILSTLAAAYAEAGNFEQAREWSTKAVEIGDPDQLEQLKSELESYKANRPWRESQSPESDDEQPDELPVDTAPAQTVDS